MNPNDAAFLVGLVAALATTLFLFAAALRPRRDPRVDRLIADGLAQQDRDAGWRARAEGDGQR